jgi:hypothetical protein
LRTPGIAKLTTKTGQAPITWVVFAQLFKILEIDPTGTITAGTQPTSKQARTARRRTWQGAPSRTRRHNPFWPRPRGGVSLGYHNLTRHVWPKTRNVAENNRNARTKSQPESEQNKSTKIKHAYDLAQRHQTNPRIATPKIDTQKLKLHLFLANLDIEPAPAEIQ